MQKKSIGRRKPERGRSSQQTTNTINNNAGKWLDRKVTKIESNYISVCTISISAKKNAIVLRARH